MNGWTQLKLHCTTNAVSRKPNSVSRTVIKWVRRIGRTRAAGKVSAVRIRRVTQRTRGVVRVSVGEPNSKGFTGRKDQPERSRYCHH